MVSGEVTKSLSLVVSGEVTKSLSRVVSGEVTKSLSRVVRGDRPADWDTRVLCHCSVTSVTSFSLWLMTIHDEWWLLLGLLQERIRFERTARRSVERPCSAVTSVRTGVVSPAPGVAR